MFKINMKTNKTFKLKGKKFYLKYILDTNIQNKTQKILDQLRYKLFSISYYCIGQEDNENNQTTIHCFIELKQTFETSSTSFFHVFIDGYMFHGNYRIGTRKKLIIDFIKDHSNKYITSS